MRREWRVEYNRETRLRSLSSVKGPPEASGRDFEVRQCGWLVGWVVGCL